MITTRVRNDHLSVIYEKLRVRMREIKRTMQRNGTQRFFFFLTLANLLPQL